MNKRAAFLLCLVLATCFALIGCGGSTSTATSNSSSEPSASATSAFVGTWDIVEASDSKETITKETFEALRKNGKDSYISFNENGTLIMVLGGDESNLAWKATRPTEGVILDTGGSEYPMSIAGGRITIDAEGTVIKLEPGNPRSTSSIASSAAASSSTTKSSKYEVSIDDATIAEDYKGNPAVVVTYTWKNNSNESSAFASRLYGRCYQNGVELQTAFMMSGVDSGGYMADVKPGAGTTFQIAYELQDTENPVEIEVTELFQKNIVYASKTFTF